MHAYLPCREIETGTSPSTSVIWLHGLGADGSDFVPVIPELRLTATTPVRFIFPDAPTLPVTCNGGLVMPAWYDIVSLEPNAREVDENGVLASVNAIRRLIARERERGMESNRIFVAGFSQGGAVAYTTALTHRETLGGVIALSCYLPSTRLVDEQANIANRSIPIFAGHGRYDDVVSPALGQLARDHLTARGYAIDWHDYPMDHSVCIEEIRDIGRWLQARL